LPTSPNGVIQSAKVSAAISAAATSINVCVKSSSRRRSSTSASAPAGSANRNIGAAAAVRTSATIVGEGASVVMSQAAPTSCIHVPMFDANAAIQSRRNTRWRSGDHAEGGAGEVESGTVATNAKIRYERRRF
jgi:hypothetical protein